MPDVSRLPASICEAWQWQQSGACRDADPRLFFHPDGERGPARRNRVAAALAICTSCPVLRQCRRHGLAVREPFGIWGGLTEDDREAIYRANRVESMQSSAILC